MTINNNPNNKSLISWSEIKTPKLPVTNKQQIVSASKKGHGVLRNFGGLIETDRPIIEAGNLGETSDKDLVNGVAAFIDGLDKKHGLHGLSALVKEKIAAKALERSLNAGSSAEASSLVKLGGKLISDRIKELTPLNQVSTEDLLDRIMNAEASQTPDRFTHNTEAQKLIAFFQKAELAQLERFLMLLGGIKGRKTKAKKIIALRQTNPTFNMTNLFNVLRGKTTNTIESKILNLIDKENVDSFLPI